jgi:L-fuculose-phosphate aldolase
MWQRSLVAANDGNISVRLPDGNVLVTPTLVSKGFLSPDMLVVVDPSGAVVHGDRRPSSEVAMHLRVYALAPSVGAVVHAHPLHATAFALRGEPLVGALLPEIVVALPAVPVAPYATPSTHEVPDSIAPLVATHTACLLEQHGALTWGVDLMTAYLTMERLEYTAHLTTIARATGSERQLSASQIARIREVFGVAA